MADLYQQVAYVLLSCFYHILLILLPHRDVKLDMPQKAPNLLTRLPRLSWPISISTKSMDNCPSFPIQPRIHVSYPSQRPFYRSTLHFLSDNSCNIYYSASQLSFIPHFPYCPEFMYHIHLNTLFIALPPIFFRIIHVSYITPHPSSPHPSSHHFNSSLPIYSLITHFSMLALYCLIPYSAF